MSISGLKNTRFLHEMHADPDGLQLPTRYPVAKYPLVDPYGAAYTAENPVQGMYMWSDQERFSKNAPPF